MALEFPKHKEHILGVTLGQTGSYAENVNRTDMEMGQPKIRVDHAAPQYTASVTVLCTSIGLALINSFWRNEAMQGARYFTWPCLRGFDSDVKMRFAGPVQNTEKSPTGLGLHSLQISLSVIELPNMNMALLGDIDAVGGAGDLLASLQILRRGTLEPELDLLGQL